MFFRIQFLISYIFQFCKVFLVAQTIGPVVIIRVQKNKTIIIQQPLRIEVHHTIFTDSISFLFAETGKAIFFRR